MDPVAAIVGTTGNTRNQEKQDTMQMPIIFTTSIEKFIQTIRESKR
jgi:hypothetical protein